MPGIALVTSPCSCAFHLGLLLFSQGSTYRRQALACRALMQCTDNTRFIARMVPVTSVGAATIHQLGDTAKIVVQEGFASGSDTPYKVSYRSQNFPSLPQLRYQRLLADLE